jgi:ribose-phosphate pyrophosphokinase
MEQMAREIAAIDNDVELGEIAWKTFPDGFPNLFVSDAERIRGRHVAFLASFHNASVIFQQLSVIYSLPKMFVASFRLILPFFPTGTMERVDKEGEIPTAVTLARMLSNIPPSRGGPTDTIIFDIHALQERFYFGDAITPFFGSGIPLLLEQLEQLEDAKDVVIAYPDEGASKRFHNFFTKYEEVVCTKVREGEKRIVTIKEGEPAGKHIVIVDDLVQSGGTLIECAKVLAREGATKVSAYVTHGVFPNESWRRFTAAGSGFEHFWITDSCPQTVSACSGTKPFVVLKLAASIARALQV